MYLGNAFLGSNSRYSIMMSAHGGGIDKNTDAPKFDSSNSDTSS